MTPNADDLAKNLAALTERFAGLAAKLIQAAQELKTSGTLPAEALLEELAAARGEFIDLRSSVLDAARARALTAPPQAEVGSLKALEPVLQAVAAAGATQVQVQRTTLVEARRRVLAVLDRVMTINHVDDPNFAVLLEAQAKAREIRAAVLDPKGPTAESAAAIMQSTPVFSALLTLIEGRDRLDAEKCAVLEDSVTRLFGPALTLAVTRGKLVAGGASARPGDPGGRGRATGAAGRGRGRDGRHGRARRWRPVVGLGVGPVDEREGHHRLQRRRQAGAVEVRLSPQRPDPAGRRLRGGAARLWLLDPARFPRAEEPRDRDAGAQQPEDVRPGQGRSRAVGRRAPLQLPARRGTPGRAVPRVRQECPGRRGAGAGALDPGEHPGVDDGDARFHAPERAGRRSGPQLAAPHAGPAAVRRSPVRRDAAVADRAVLRGGRGPQRTARDRREADGGPRRFRRCVAPDDTARGPRGPQVGADSPRARGNLGARAREGLRRAVGWGVQCAAGGGEELRADPDLEEGRALQRAPVGEGVALSPSGGRSPWPARAPWAARPPSAARAVLGGLPRECVRKGSSAVPSRTSG